MLALRAADVLALWETGHPLHPVDRALVLLGATDPQRTRDELAALPLGQRDARLLALRERTFGDRLSASARCPDCGELAEFDLSCRALRGADQAVGNGEVEVAGYTIGVRALNSFDLAAAVCSADVSSARRALMTRCVTSARRGDAAVAPDELPDALCEDIGAAALATDPAAERLLDLRCPQCTRAWQITLDVAHVLWSEIAARARRVLLEVHLLARAYGWSEAEILALSDGRRGIYLQMVSP